MGDRRRDRPSVGSVVTAYVAQTKKSRPVVIIKWIGREFICIPLTTSPVHGATHPLYTFRIKIVENETNNLNEIQIRRYILRRPSYLEGHFVQMLHEDDIIEVFPYQSDNPGFDANQVIEKTVKRLFV